MENKIELIASGMSIDDQIIENFSIVEHCNISEGLKYHISNNLPLYECIYRPYSLKHYELIEEAKKLKSENKIIFRSDHWLNETDVGKFAHYGGKLVPLDLPILIEWEEVIAEKKKKKSKKKSKKKKKKKDPPLNKPMTNPGKGKKWKVYVKNPKTGNIKKITFGDKKGGLKGNWNDPEARKNFASRHNCAKKTDKMTAGYWACRAHKYFGKNVPGRFW